MEILLVTTKKHSIFDFCKHSYQILFLTKKKAILETEKILFSGSLFVAQLPLHLLIAYIFVGNKTREFILNTASFLFLQTEGVDVKREKCEAFATGQTASHLINSTKPQSCFT